MAINGIGSLTLAFSVCLLAGASCQDHVRYLPNWESLDSRPLPAWYDEAKLGVFITWGLYSVPSFNSEWFWFRWKSGNPEVKQFMAKNYPPGFTYADFAADFTAEFFQAEEWARLFEASGAKYLVFVTKHHSGYTNWPSKYSYSWNSMDVGPRRDIVGELADAVKNHTQMKFGLYHSLFEWFHPLYLQDKANNFTTQNFVLQKTLPELYELVSMYEPEVVWSDGDWDAPDVYWNSTEFLAWLYNDSPVKDTVVTNDRWGKGITCHHGGVWTCRDRYNPGILQKRKWVNAMTLDRKSWGFRREATLADYLSMEELLRTFAMTVSCGGNMLMNVGPTKDGMISPIYQERLTQMGQWMKVNGEAIYSSRPWTYQNDTLSSDVWYTMKQSGATRDVYAIVLKWPSAQTLTLGAPVPGTTTLVSLLGHPGHLDFHHTGQQGLVISLPVIDFSSMPCQWAWTLKLTSITN